ncbi:LOB domain-containing protein 36-like [Salvia miltiorrhiza]|uniref:LOB domain-containing protein 36-like n=1 Tax=Salvia miltiorrhiza TaxID=226208 RepID=UPI0025AD89AC|nr:LOB domain-containing protein 36-like [Salvia miltiorrhiza]XP_057788700.1 LOB domain-containing protein 36-like [Salvia miltiorrhiza]XP_057788701.1 LOB domain-containing protein 36-like [Salvia miltiorrhiza]
MSSSNSPCAACKCLRRKCTQECVFAPYFPPDNPQKFTNVHKVFGASNVSKLLNELNASQREDAVNSLAYEAEYRLRDPVYGCVGLISILQQKLKQVQLDLDNAKKELATYIGPSAMLPIYNHPQHHSNYGPSGYQMLPYNVQPITQGMAQLMIREQQQQQQQFLEAHQLAAAAREQEMMRSYEQQQNHELMRFNGGGFDDGPVTATGFNQIGGGGAPSLALGSSYEAIPEQQQQSNYHLQQQLQQDLLLQHSNHQAPPPQAQQQQHQQRAKSEEEEERSIAPPC